MSQELETYNFICRHKANPEDFNYLMDFFLGHLLTSITKTVQTVWLLAFREILILLKLNQQNTLLDTLCCLQTFNISVVTFMESICYRIPIQNLYFEPCSTYSKRQRGKAHILNYGREKVKEKPPQTIRLKKIWDMLECHETTDLPWVCVEISSSQKTILDNLPRKTMVKRILNSLPRIRE